MSTLLNTNNICSECGGRVANIQGKRYGKQQMAEMHMKVCPGIARRKKGSNDDDQR